MRIVRREALLLAAGWAGGSMALSATSAVAAAARDHWVATWTAGLQDAPAQTVTAKNQTVRHRVEISVGGPRLRIVLSNEFGKSPLKVGAASVAILNKDGFVQPATFARINFGGLPDVIIPPGVRMVSDSVEFKTDALQALAVNLFLPEETVLATFHNEDHRTYEQKAYVASTERVLTGAMLSAAGDFTAAAAFPLPQTPMVIFPPFLSAVDTVAPVGTPVLVILGDTKSEGPDFWPHYLRRRLAIPTGGGVAIANQAQSAGTLVLDRPGGTAITRFDRDVLGVAGATHVLLFNGSNDVVMPGFAMNISATIPTHDVILAMKQVADRAHSAGLKVIGATLLPFENVVIRKGYATPEHLRMRDEINQWVRTSGTFDEVVDFDTILRDPAHPQYLLPDYDSGNHFIPSEAGFRAMAAAIKSEWFH